MTIVAVVVIAATAGGQPQGPCDGTDVVPALVTVQTAGPESFVVRVLEQALLDEMIDICEGTSPQRIVIGDLLTGNGGYNHDVLNGTIWSWHLVEDTLGLAEVTIELCDGRPSFVEAELAYWMQTVGSYCPWSSQIVAIAADTAIPGDFDVDGDVDLDDFAVLESCLTIPAQQCYGQYDGVAACCAADLDGSTFIDCDDWALFVLAWTEPGPPPNFELCADPVPTISQWGAIVMAVLIPAAGAFVFARRKRERAAQ